MRGIMAGGLGISLGLWLAGAKAADPPTAFNSQVALGKPEPLSRSITLGRPVAMPPGSVAPIQDRAVQPASFVTALFEEQPPIIRAQKADNPRPMPSGPNLDPPASTSNKATPDSGSAPELLTQPRLVPVAPAKTTPSTIVESSDSASACGTCDCCECCGEDRWGPFGWFPLWHWGECVETPPHVIWTSAEFLAWGIKDTHYPPLVTTSPVGTSRTNAGVLNTPGVMTLFGGSPSNNEEQAGIRFNFGFWFDQEQTIGLEAGFFILPERSVRFSDGSPGSPILARPFFDALTNREASELVAFPGVLAGNISATAASRLWGAELNLREELWRGCCWRIDWLTGFRYLALDESLNVMENLTVPGTVGSGIQVWDQFGTHNSFYGGQIGTDIELRKGPWSLDLLTKVALGSTHETANINGSTTFTSMGTATSVQPGGLLALPSNIGRFSRDRFTVVPEVGLKLGYQVTPRLRLVAGYTFLYSSSVIRPDRLIDRVVNTSQLPTLIGPGTLIGPARPMPILRGTDFWAQGVTVGLEYRW